MLFGQRSSRLVGKVEKDVIGKKVKEKKKMKKVENESERKGGGIKKRRKFRRE